MGCFFERLSVGDQERVGSSRFACERHDEDKSNAGD